MVATTCRSQLLAAIEPTQLQTPPSHVWMTNISFVNNGTRELGCPKWRENNGHIEHMLDGVVA